MTSREPLPPAVQSLIDRCLSTMEQVELLVWLAEDESRSATAAELAQVIHGTPDHAARGAGHLRDAGLAQLEGDRWRYRPANSAAEAAVKELLAMYHQRPVSLVRAIYERPVSPVRSFADAFRLRGDD